MAAIPGRRGRASHEAGAARARPRFEAAAEGAEAVVIGYGAFVQSVIDFVIIGLCVFLVVKAYNSMQKKEEEKPEEPAAPAEDIVLLQEIRDTLKSKATV